MVDQDMKKKGGAMARWLINCEEFSTLISQQMDCPLTLRERISMQIHQLICPPCRFIKQNFNTIRQACRWTPADEEESDLTCDTLPEDVAERIKSAIKKCPKHTP